jgi:outer membrane autotransporter protein
VTDKILVGLAVHSDHMSDPGKGTNVEGTGVLVGPYASIAFAPSLYLDASVLYGQSWNTLDMGEFEGNFDTTRFMATTKLEGLLEYGPLTLRPNMKLNYLTERVDDYSVSNSAAQVAIEGFTQDDLRASLGITASYAIRLDNEWDVTPELSGSIGMSSSGDSSDNDGRLFGTIDAGIIVARANSWSTRISGIIDVNENSDVAVGGKIGLEVQF